MIIPQKIKIAFLSLAFIFIFQEIFSLYRMSSSTYLTVYMDTVQVKRLNQELKKVYVDKRPDELPTTFAFDGNGKGYFNEKPSGVLISVEKITKKGLWIPFIKPMYYKAELSLKFKHNGNTFKTVKKAFWIEGHVLISGLCSYRLASKILMKTMTEQSFKATKNLLQKEDK